MVSAKSFYSRISESTGVLLKHREEKPLKKTHIFFGGGHIDAIIIPLVHLANMTFIKERGCKMSCMLECAFAGIPNKACTFRDKLFRLTKNLLKTNIRKVLFSQLGRN